MISNLIDYNNCPANLANSILQHYGIPTHHGTLPLADAALKQRTKNTIVLLLDGMGVQVIRDNLPENGFFRRNLIGSYTSVFPPTTTAATVSVTSGLYPNEHCWLGWDCYFPEIDETVTLFPNTKAGTREPAADFNVAERYCPFPEITQSLQKVGTEAHYLSKYTHPNCATFDGLCETVAALCQKDGEKYIYCYWEEPDSTMHRTGCDSSETQTLLSTLETQIEQLCARLYDTTVLITADHGHINTKSVYFPDYPDLYDCLARVPSIETRAMNLFVKEDRRAFFEKRFRETFGDAYMLLSKEEVIASRLFGPGKDRERFCGMLGDYLAVAVGDLTILKSYKTSRFTSVHGGMTEAEVFIPLICISCV